MAQDEAFKAVHASISSALVDVTRTVGQISNEDLAFHRSSNPSIAPILDEQASNLLNLVKQLTTFAVAGSEVAAPRLRDVDSVEDNWKGIVDVIDNLLEKTDACLDEYTGVIKRLSPSQENKAPNPASLSKRQLPARSYRDREIPKPQLLFNKVSINTETTPFKPLLRSKPHAIVPLVESLILNTTQDGIKHYKHPYEVEITGSQYPPTVYTKSEPISSLPFESTKATLVDTPEALKAMLEELKQAKEIAVDLEHHDTHSFVGLVSLMQISTRNRDWIVDTLKPWRTDLQILNEVFADPNVVKVFHGAYMDMVWLQRDLGLYVVGLFDTFHASRCLKYPRNSLAMLLKRFLDFDADKQYQMADWRIRPLPEAMFNYARSDTHFLLYIYDNLRNELLEKSDLSLPDGDLIDEVLQKSKAETLQRYERPIYDALRGRGPAGWYNMLWRTPSLFNKEQFAVFRAVHQWRDKLARKEDEGIHQIMPKHVIFNLAREMPMDMPSLLGCSHPISATVRSRTGELLHLIREAKIAGATGPEMKELIDPGQDAVGDVAVYGKARIFALDVQSNITASPNDESAKLSSSGNPSVRTKTSSFWGTTLEDSTSLRQKIATQRQYENTRLALPLPPLTAEVFQEAGSEGVLENVNQQDPGARAEQQYVKERKPKETDVFVVKQVGGSRKRKVDEMHEHRDSENTGAPSHGLHVDSDNNVRKEEIDVVEVKSANDSQDLAVQKKANKRLKRQRKKEQKREDLRRMNETENRVAPNEEEPFDYANAPSMLQAKRDKIGGREAKKSFDPYTKSLDAPKGMRKTKKEIAGKSFTFKG